MQRWRSGRRLPTTTAPYYPAKQIAKNLWVGSEGDSSDGAFFARHRIALVVNATDGIPFRAPAGVSTYRIPVDDHPSENDTMLRHFPIVVVAMDEVLSSGQGVLVHCRAGMQRSAAVAAAYLMWKRGYTADKAMTFVNSKKHETFWPRPTFEVALRAWEAALRRRNRIK